VTFPPDKLKIADVAEGDFFRQGGMPTSLSQSVDEGAGRLQLGVLRQQATGAIGQGTVAVLRFKALAAGPAQVSVVSTDPIGIDGPVARPPLPLPHTLQVR
jgi:general secretion pathway protein D